MAEERLTDMLRRVIHPAQVQDEKYVTFTLVWFEDLVDCIDALELNFEKDEEYSERLSEMKTVWERDGAE